MPSKVLIGWGAKLVSDVVVADALSNNSSMLPQSMAIHGNGHTAARVPQRAVSCQSGFAVDVFVESRYY